MKVTLSEAALDDTEQIATAMASYDLPAALRFHSGIHKFIALLNVFPKRYPAWSEDERLRKAVYRRWTVFYSVIESRDTVWIERVSR